MAENIFLQISLLLALTVGAAFILRLLRQPLIIAYLAVGVLAGPMFFNLLKGGANVYDAFAKIGVVLLLFVVGLNLNLGYLKKIGKVAIITGLAQVTLTALIGMAILQALKFSLLSSIYLAVAITFSSTIIITKLLNEKKHTESMYGRYVIGLMLMQDFVAIIIMMILGITRQQAEFSAGAPLALKIIFLAGFILALTKYIAPAILKRVADSGEFLFVFTLAWCLGIASITYWLGFPVEVGAIIAGLTLGSTPYQPEISSRVKPLRDFFIVLFFIILGGSLELNNLRASLAPGLILSLYILIGNPLILYILYRLHKFNRRNSFLSALTAAQVSEFGFILLYTGAGIGHLGKNEIPVFTLVALITIFISSYLITYNERIYHFLKPFFALFGKDNRTQKEDDAASYDVWVFGYHRIGWKVCEALIEKKIKFAVVDYNPEIISKLKKRGVPSYFGDASDIEFLDALPLGEAKLIISTLPTVEDQRALIAHVKHNGKIRRGRARQAPFFIASLYDDAYLQELYEMGADYVMMPHLLGGQRIYDVLKRGHWAKEGLKKLRQYQKDEHNSRFEALGARHC
ncbi:hypothetical protein EPN28_03550 [Patescibacteria group bacterium]|nr:MAG: hypothetical protein EPN28_03550 [Patescibacteria group bacterium]